MRLFSRSGRVPGKAACIVGALAVCLVLTGGVDNARADSLQQLLEQVGSEYAEAYASPFIHTFGPNQNANLYSTAHIPWTGLTFGIGVKVMTTNLNEADQTFQKVVQIPDLGILDPALSGQSGTAVMSGPTIFGDTETDGKIDVYANGVLAGTLEGIPGFWDTRWVPLATPEAYIGGIAGLKFTLRYFPSMEMGDFGKYHVPGLRSVVERQRRAERSSHRHHGGLFPDQPGCGKHPGPGPGQAGRLGGQFLLPGRQQELADASPCTAVSPSRTRR